MKKKAFAFILILILLPHGVYAETVSDGKTLQLINGDSRLADNFVPSGLIKHQGLMMHPSAAEAFEKMKEAMKADGLDGLFIQSAYRDFSHQKFLFSQKVSSYLNRGMNEAEADVLAAQTVARPGASEHQSGLALDVTLDGTLNQSFGETEPGKWLDENCRRFGFIIRYPQDKIKITKIIYEPWHIRYVGVPHAAFMKEKNFCLEEYLDYLAENKMSIYWLEGNDKYFLIKYSDYISTELKHLIN